MSQWKLDRDSLLVLVALVKGHVESHWDTVL